MTLNIVEQGNGIVAGSDDVWTLALPTALADTYSNAMLTSYIVREDFDFGAGTRMELTASATGTFSGTAGFGFWNHPYGMGFPRLPRAVWFFFGSAANDMPLALGVPGSGFKAAVFDARRLAFLLLVPFTPLGVLLTRVPLLYRLLWPVGQRAIGVDECALSAALLTRPRRYVIDWTRERVAFSIDDEVVFTTRRVPRGYLGFVAWVDNQYAVVTPQGRVRFGLVDAEGPQSLVISGLSLTRT